MARIRANFENELRQKLSQKSTAYVSEETLLLRAFKYFDLDNSGAVSYQEWLKALEKIGIVVNNESQLRELFDYYDADKSGEVDYTEFTAVLFGQQSATGRRLSPQKAGSQAQEGEAALEKLRNKLASRGGRGIIGLARQFKIMDDDNSKHLSLYEFSKAIRDFRVDLSESEIQALFNYIDRDRSGMLDYDEFLRSIRGPMNSFRRGLVNQAFNKLDKDGSGIIDIDDVRGVYNARGHPDVRSGKKTEEDILGEFLETFEMHHNINGARDRRVTLEEFMEYYNNISASIDNDQYFELMMNNTWKLSEAPATRRQRAPEPRREPARPSRPAGPTNESVEALLEKFRHKLAARGARGFIGMQRQFKIMDDDNSKSISLAEFKKGMHDFRVNVEEGDLERLYNAIDRDRSGHVDYDELIRAIRGPMSQARRRIVDQAWNKLDRDRSGIVDINDLKGVYDASGHPDVRSGKKTEDEILGEFLETFETHHNISDLSQRDQRVTKEEFEEYYNNISACIDDDRYFELMMNNAWKLGEQPTPRTAWAGEVGSRAAAGSRGPSRPTSRQAPFATEQETREPAAKSTRSAPRPVKEALEKLRKRLASRGSRGFIGLQRQFKIMDDDNSHSLDFQEFWKGMRDFRVGLTEEESRLLFDFIDADKGGHIDYEEFIHQLRGSMNQNRQSLVERAFKMLDKNGNGVVELDDIKGVYNAKNHPDVRSGKKTEDDILCEFLDTFEQHHAMFKENTRDFRVTFEEFLEYYNHVSASIDDDRYFELMMKNSWNFEGNSYGKGWGSDMTGPARRNR